MNQDKPVTLGIYIPTLNRPHKLEALVKNIHENTTLPHKIYFVAEPEDVATQEKVKELGETLVISRFPGTHTGAANTVYWDTPEPFFIVANDDFLFHKDWDTKAMEKMVEPYAVIGLNDMGAQACNTIFLIRRSYIEEQSGVIDHPNTLFYPGYNHSYVDNELYETAIKRGVFATQPESHVEHMHPGFGKSPKDATYGKADSKVQVDQETYRNRRHLWQ